MITSPRIVWRTSTRSTSGSGQCVEVGALVDANWRTSTRSASSGGQCVEAGPINDTSGRVALRDSKDRNGPAFISSRNEWAGFIAAVKREDFGN